MKWNKREEATQYTVWKIRHLNALMNSRTPSHHFKNIHSKLCDSRVQVSLILSMAVRSTASCVRMWNCNIRQRVTSFVRREQALKIGDGEPRAKRARWPSLQRILLALWTNLERARVFADNRLVNTLFVASSEVYTAGILKGEKLFTRLGSARLLVHVRAA